jgi:hypothetical protein
MILQKKAVETFERPLDRERLLQQGWAILLFPNGLDKAVHLAGDDLCPMDCPFFEFLIYHS